MKKFALILPAFLLLGCQNESAKTESKETVYVEPTFEIAPPVAEYEAEKEVFSIDNSKDTILISEHGSFIHVPADCFVDNTGKAATDVQVMFTEYSNPADILFSGIPMVYVAEDGNKTFQSAGMCEITASSKGKEVAITDDKSIDIGLKNQAQDGDYNLYYFDEQIGEWIEKEEDLVVDATPIPAKPLTTNTIDLSRVVHVDVMHPKLNRDFQMWDKSNFYLLPGQEPIYHDKRAFWYNLEVVNTTNPEIFVLKFNGTIDGEQVVEALTVQPMVAPENYDKAMSAFNKKMRKHAKMILKKRKGKKELLSADETVVQIKEEHGELLEERRIEDSIRIADYQAASEVRSDVMRTFKINEFGLYNCDRFYVREILATKQVKFKNNGAVLDFNFTSLCAPRDNAVLTAVAGNNNEYTIELSSGTFYFVGLKGKDIYCKKVDTQTANGTHEIEPISKAEFENLMR